MNSSILSSIKKRNSLLLRFKRDPKNVELYREYCKVRNAVQRDVKKAKEDFFKQGVEKNQRDAGKLWCHLRSLGYSKKTAVSHIVLEEHGSKVFDPCRVAEVFNAFYTSVATNLVAKLPNPYGLFQTHCSNFKDFYFRKIGLRPHFVLTAVSTHFIRKQLKALDPKKAIGLDDISSLFLRDGADCITLPVSHIINTSIMTECVPNGFKEAKVIPLFKKGSRLDPGNYRPVSILSVLSKVLERSVYVQLSEYLEKRELLSHAQSGFRGGYSTDSSLICLTDFLKREIGKGNFIGMVLIDLQKAFDTVDHEILLAKLGAVGVDSVDWFKSYLFDRRQCCEVSGARSEFLPISCGVPQGSILGPLLFLIYINDMSLSISCSLSLYADDSAIYFAHKDASIIAERLSKELSSCKRWLVDNKLSLHIGKTESLLFGSRGRLRRVKGFTVFCEGTAVKQVSHVKYLGITLDANLNGSQHAMNILKTCAGRLAFLFRNSSFLDCQSRKMLCIALIQPYLDYCVSSWYSGLTTLLKRRLDVIQRKMVRFVFGFDSRQHVGNSELRGLAWLSVPDQVDFFKSLHIFRIRHGLALPYNLSQKKRRICFLSFLLLILIQMKQTICHLESF